MICPRSDSQPNTPCLAHGYADMEGGSAAWLALESDRAPVLLFDNFPGNSQSHAGAFADGFSREAGLEGLVLLLGRHAAPGIGDRDVDHPALVPGAHDDLP